MLSYNTRLKKLVLPEYGRNVQRMVDHCLTIEDREERTRCARFIIATMSNLVPALGNSEEYRHKLWDHLAIMSDFKLDIDYPCEVIRPESLQSVPEPLDYHIGDFKYRHYGKYLELLIAKAVSLPEGGERDSLVMLIANHMKKSMLAVNADGVDDEKIFRDLAELSHGAIRLSPETTKLHEFHQEVVQTTGKKKKKK